MKERVKKLYMDMAFLAAKMSYAIRLQVGALIVKDDNIISFSWNGTPPGWDNTCEDKIYANPTIDDHIEYPFSEGYIDHDWVDLRRRYKLKTKPIVIHAEANAISKLAKNYASGKDATMFCTHAPCIDCAKLIFGAGISKVYYGIAYRDTLGVDFLEKCGVEVEQMKT